jgi:hypothetical protein
VKAGKSKRGTINALTVSEMKSSCRAVSRLLLQTAVSKILSVRA